MPRLRSRVSRKWLSLIKCLKKCHLSVSWVWKPTSSERRENQTVLVRTTKSRQKHKDSADMKQHPLCRQSASRFCCVFSFLCFELTVVFHSSSSSAVVFNPLRWGDTSAVYRRKLYLLFMRSPSPLSFFFGSNSSVLWLCNCLCLCGDSLYFLWLTFTHPDSFWRLLSTEFIPVSCGGRSND